MLKSIGATPPPSGPATPTASMNSQLPSQSASSLGSLNLKSSKRVPLHKGYLKLRCGRFFTAWSRFWCVLDDNGNLKVYKGSAPFTNPKYTIPMKDFLVDRVKNSLDIQLLSKSKENSDLRFRVEDPEDKPFWLSKLRTAHLINSGYAPAHWAGSQGSSNSTDFRAAAALSAYGSSKGSSLLNIGVLSRKNSNSSSEDDKRPNSASGTPTIPSGSEEEEHGGPMAEKERPRRLSGGNLNPFNWNLGGHFGHNLPQSGSFLAMRTQSCVH